MHTEDADKLLVVLLDDLVNHSLPRILAIRKHLDNGETLCDSELEFFQILLKQVNLCYMTYSSDKQCGVIFSTIAHLIFKVIKLALKNEKRQAKTRHYANQQAGDFELAAATA